MGAALVRYPRAARADRSADRLRTATGRYLITIAFGILHIPLILDYLWPLWDSQNQTLHDKIPLTSS
ncbi:MAG TPA: RDD family protein [Gaiellaceae bacterium]|nr:RDD family protein [Gaiellaceae bacterium]